MTLGAPFINHDQGHLTLESYMRGGALPLRAALCGPPARARSQLGRSHQAFKCARADTWCWHRTQSQSAPSRAHTSHELCLDAPHAMPSSLAQMSARQHPNRTCRKEDSVMLPSSYGSRRTSAQCNRLCHLSAAAFHIARSLCGLWAWPL